MKMAAGRRPVGDRHGGETAAEIKEHEELQLEFILEREKRAREERRERIF
ncbi:hypothetical protein A2U01_0068356, partial [Trifolium medium]|nr:hypothetical protein [Trifolium medium]